MARVKAEAHRIVNNNNKQQRPQVSSKGPGIGKTLKIGDNRGFKRHVRYTSDPKDLVFKKAFLKRASRWGGARSVSRKVYEQVKEDLCSKTEEIMKIACEITSYRKALTISESDILYALRKIGMTVYTN